MLSEFINTDVNFTTSTQNDSLSDTMILQGHPILQDYRKVYEPESRTDDEDEEEGEAEEHEEDDMEVEPDREVEELRSKVIELNKIKESNELEIASLKSVIEEKDAIEREKEIIQKGVLNSLEDKKKVLNTRINRYKEAVPKLRKELDELREADKEKGIG